MANKILFVDDEPSILSGFERMLHREFFVETAIGGEAGLIALRESGPYAVIVSDMRMPGMSGAQFLAQARIEAPDSVRMLLTGYTELNAAIEAVNQGNIFRFLTKPCPKDDLVTALTAGIEQNQLIRAERDLLEKTLLGSIKVLADFLSVSNPEAFGRSMRIAHWAKHIAQRFPSTSDWRVEAAATLSQLGCVTLSPDLVQRGFAGIPLGVEEKARFEAHPATAMRLLSGIPRLESVAWMIGQQLNANITSADIDSLNLSNTELEEVLRAARILRVAVVFEELRTKGLDQSQAIQWLRQRPNEFNRDFVEALTSARPDSSMMEVRKVSTLRLATGMVLEQDVRNQQGNLIAAKGQEITRAVLTMLENHAHAGLIERELLALVPA
jgi:ActR/RegA family two-component response regulator